MTDLTPLEEAAKKATLQALKTRLRNTSRKPASTPSAEVIPIRSPSLTVSPSMPPSARRS